MAMQGELVGPLQLDLNPMLPWAGPRSRGWGRLHAMDQQLILADGSLQRRPEMREGRVGSYHAFVGVVRRCRIGAHGAATTRSSQRCRHCSRKP